MTVQAAHPILPDLLLESFHREMPWVALSRSAELPRLPGSAARDKGRQMLLQDLLDCERTLRAAETLFRKRERSGASEINPREVRSGWRKFFLAHAAFFYVFALLADLYRQCTAALGRGDRPLREIEQACALWRLAGALMLYGVDFWPTETIYQNYIRPQMPEAFSGTWLREYALLAERRKGLDRLLHEKAEADGELVSSLRSHLSEGQRCYHNFHFQVMLACVPDMTSRLQQYELEHGSLSLEEKHFQIYDDWFHVLRLPETELSCYVRSACAVFSEILADLVEGTFLEPEPLKHLTNGISMVLEILQAEVRGQAVEPTR